MERHKFLKYLAQCHGRCYNEVKSSPGSYRRDIMRLCTEDTSYDMQCEGSRALYAYDLVKLYDDIAPFAKKTVGAFEKAEKDDDSHDWWHLCDMTALFAFDAKDR
ncbi:MAG: hypothetical protein J6X85_03015, partial [Ruminococcus sp.]|nr:hypothetical protein [Ruminococcus sp.]